MKCPIDGETLLMTQRSGIEIDYCPKCRGVWLDRGELDKLIEREGDDDRDENRAYDNRSSENRGYDNRVQDNRPYDNRPHDSRSGEVNPVDLIRGVLGSKSGHKCDDDYRYGHKKKKKGGLLGEIFDF